MLCPLMDGARFPRSVRDRLQPQTGTPTETDMKSIRLCRMLRAGPAGGLMTIRHALAKRPRRLLPIPIEKIHAEKEDGQKHEKPCHDSPVTPRHGTSPLINTANRPALTNLFAMDHALR